MATQTAIGGLSVAKSTPLTTAPKKIPNEGVHQWIGSGPPPAWFNNTGIPNAPTTTTTPATTPTGVGGSGGGGTTTPGSGMPGRDLSEPANMPTVPPSITGINQASGMGAMSLEGGDGVNLPQPGAIRQGLGKRIMPDSAAPLAGVRIY